MTDLYLMSFYDKLLGIGFIEMEDVVAIVLELKGDEGFADEVRLESLLMAVLEVRFADGKVSIVDLLYLCLDCLLFLRDVLRLLVLFCFVAL